MRPQRAVRGISAVCLVAVLLAACSATRSATTIPPAPVGTLRGSKVDRFSCPPPAPGGSELQMPAGSVTELLLCPPQVPHQQEKPFTVTPANPAFRQLLTALAAPDAPRTDQPCPAIAVVPAPIVARSGAVTMLVKVPLDRCALPQGAVGAAINKARAG